MIKKGTEIEELAEKTLGKENAEKILQMEEDITLIDNFPDDTDEELNLSEDKLKMYNSIFSNIKAKRLFSTTYNIENIEGIETHIKELKDAGIKTIEDLLEKGKSKKGREELVKVTGISKEKILTWCNTADMFRIKGVSSQNSELLVVAGVDTVKKPRNRKIITKQENISK